MENSNPVEMAMAMRTQRYQERAIRDAQVKSTISAVATSCGVVAACLYGTSFWSVVGTFIIYYIIVGATLGLIIGSIIAISDLIEDKKLES